jgi:glycosyltransferase 2 family protein
LINQFPRKKILISIIGIMIFYTVFIIYFDAEKLLKIIGTMNVELIPLILGIQFISFFFRSVRQKIFLKKIKIQISTKKSFLVFLSGLSMLMTPGGTGGIIKAQFLKNEYGYSRRKTIPIVIYERYHDFLAIITIMGIFSIFYSIYITQILLIISSIILFFTYLILKNQKILKKIFGKIEKIKIIKKISSDFLETNNSISQLMSSKIFLQGWLIGVCAVLLDLIAVYLIFISLDIDYTFFMSSQLFLASVISGVLSFLPAGIGVTEGSLLGLFMINGMELSFASATVLIIRFLTLWFSTIVGFITLKFLKF